MKLRGREFYIIVAVVAVVVGVLWFFFLYGPEHKKVATLNTQLIAQQSTLTQTQLQIRQLTLLKNAAPQAEADLIKLHQVVPSESAIPSFIVALTTTAQASGLAPLGVTPMPTAAGVPFSVQPINLHFDGAYFDVEDFLYRLENYVAYRNGQFLVTGRMFSVVNLTLSKTKLTGKDWPDLDVLVTINGYQWTPAGATVGAQ